MKLVLPVNVSVTFYPTPMDDTRITNPRLSEIGIITDDNGDKIKMFYGNNGKTIEMHHSNEAIAIIRMEDLIASIVATTFYRIAGPEVLQPNLAANQ